MEDKSFEVSGLFEWPADFNRESCRNLQEYYEGGESNESGEPVDRPINPPKSTTRAFPAPNYLDEQKYALARLRIVMDVFKNISSHIGYSLTELPRDLSERMLVELTQYDSELIVSLESTGIRISWK